MSQESTTPQDDTSTSSMYDSSSYTCYGYPGTRDIIYAEPHNQPEGTVVVLQPKAPSPTHVLDMTGNWELPITEEQINAYVDDARRDAILRAWPVSAQLEALTENMAGRPEKLNKLLSDISQIKQEFPKAGE